jgi:hypothetical protein
LVVVVGTQKPASCGGDWPDSGEYPSAHLPAPAFTQRGISLLLLLLRGSPFFERLNVVIPALIGRGVLDLLPVYFRKLLFDLFKVLGYTFQRAFQASNRMKEAGQIVYLVHVASLP